MNIKSCKRCGRCCREAQGFLQATSEDIKRWRSQHRQDILSYADIYPLDVADLWFDPVTHEELCWCPFLGKVGLKEYACTIYETKPEQCNDWYCVLCSHSQAFKEGEEVPIGAHIYTISNLGICPECQKRGICKRHNFVSTKWLKNYTKKA